MKRNLLLVTLVVMGLILASCAPATPQIVEVPKEVIVEKEVVSTVVVEKVVVSTVVVEKEVEKKVVETVIVETEKAVEVVVTATPEPTMPAPQVPTEKQSGGTLNIWQPNGWPDVSWPHQSHWESRWAISVMGEYLFEALRDGSLDGRLATGYDVSDDGLVYTLHLRPDVTWHDGQPFTADDVVYSMHLWWNPDLKPRVSPGAYGDLIVGIKAYTDKEADTIEGVKKVDDLAVEITLDTPHPSFPRVFASNRYVVPKHALEKLDQESLLNGTDKYWTTAPVGTGPYQFVKYVTDQYIEFTRYDDWWGGAPGPERLFLKIASASTALIMLENGELDFVTEVPATEVEGLQENPNIEMLVKISDVDAYGLLRNFWTMDGFWRDPKAVQAFMYSLDRQGFIDSILAGEGKIVNSIFDGSMYTCPTMTEYTYDPEKADELWTELGLPREKRSEVTIDFMSWLGIKSRMDMLPVWQENMRSLGFKSNVDFIDNSLVNQYRDGDGPRDRDWDFYVTWIGWGGDPFSIFNYLEPESGTNVGMYGYPFPPGSENKKEPDWIYDNPRIAELKQLALGTTDPDELKTIFQEVDCIFNEELPFLHLVAPPSYEAKSARLQGVSHEKLTGLYDIGNWWIWEE